MKKLFLLILAVPFIFPPTVFASALFGPNISFEWLTKITGQYTDAELTDIAGKSNFVPNLEVMVPDTSSPNGVSQDLGATEQAALILRQKNPNAKILFYWHTMFERVIDVKWSNSLGFNTNWYLKDNNGNVITAYYPGTKTIDGYFYDYTNPAFLAWANNTLKNIMSTGQYDGLALDDLNPIVSTGVFLAPGEFNNLSSAKIAAWNTALINFASNTKRLNSTKTIIYNNHTYSYMDTTLSNLDGMLEENFCYRFPDQVLTTINNLQNYNAKGKIILDKDNIGTLSDQVQISKWGRFCYGAFLMGFKPGFGFYKFSHGYGFSYMPGDIDLNSEEINLPLGNPTAPYVNSSGLLYRNFTNAIVYVNTSTTNKVVTLPQSMQIYYGNNPGAVYASGQKVTVTPQDALFFLKTITPTPTPFSIPGDFNHDGHVNYTDFSLLTTSFGNPYTLFDFNNLVSNFGK